MLDSWSQSDPDHNRQFKRCWAEPPWLKRRTSRPGQGDSNRQCQSIEAPDHSAALTRLQKELRDHLFAG